MSPSPEKSSPGMDGGFGSSKWTAGGSTRCWSNPHNNKARRKGWNHAGSDLRDGSNSDANIENKLGMPAQLFNSFDPSLFHERNPDEDAEAYEFPLQTPAGYPPA